MSAVSVNGEIIREWRHVSFARVCMLSSISTMTRAHLEHGIAPPKYQNVYVYCNSDNAPRCAGARKSGPEMLECMFTTAFTIERAIMTHGKATPKHQNAHYYCNFYNAQRSPGARTEKHLRISECVCLFQYLLCSHWSMINKESLPLEPCGVASLVGATISTFRRRCCPNTPSHQNHWQKFASDGLH